MSRSACNDVDEALHFCTAKYFEPTSAFGYAFTLPDCSKRNNLNPTFFKRRRIFSKDSYNHLSGISLQRPCQAKIRRIIVNMYPARES